MKNLRDSGLKEDHTSGSLKILKEISILYKSRIGKESLMTEDAGGRQRRSVRGYCACEEEEEDNLF